MMIVSVMASRRVSIIIILVMLLTVPLVLCHNILSLIDREQFESHATPHPLTVAFSLTGIH